MIPDKNEIALIPRLTPEFLETLVMAAKCLEWTGYYGEVCYFVCNCHRLAGVPEPDMTLNPADVYSVINEGRLKNANDIWGLPVPDESVIIETEYSAMNIKPKNGSMFTAHELAKLLMCSRDGLVYVTGGLANILFIENGANEPYVRLERKDEETPT